MALDNKTQKKERLPDRDESSRRRPPVIAILGHIDHGKSTLLDYIQKTTITEQEAGGITQHLSAYEAVHTDKEGIEKRLTFIDTPGHEAFRAQRTRGATAADIAILIISAEDGMMPQTKEALETIQENKVPFVVAINKIDRPSAQPEKVLNDLTEAGVYVEGRGGQISYVNISAKTGEGVDELLEVLLLIAELEELSGDPDEAARGFVIESNRDPQKGVSAVLIIKDGTLETGTYVATKTSYAPVRAIEDFKGGRLTQAAFSSPIRITGWSSLPLVGTFFETFPSKKDALSYIEASQEKQNIETNVEEEEEGTVVIPLILKADAAGTIEALEHEIAKIKKEKVRIKIIHADVGDISEADVKAAGGDENTLIVGFGVAADSRAKERAQRDDITVGTFIIIYEMARWLEGEIEERRPRIKKELEHGTLKVMKTFSATSKRQVVGGKVAKGVLATGDTVKISRRDNVIGEGRIAELQTQRVKTRDVSEGTECGISVDTHTELAAGDLLTAYTIVEE